MSRKNPPLQASFNGQVPRDGEPDVLWHFLSWIILIVADEGTEVRFYGRQSKRESGIHGVNARVYMSVNGKWFESVPPSCALQRLQFRLLNLFGQAPPSQLFPKRPFKRDTELRFCFERPFTVRIGQGQATGTCRIASAPGRLKIRFLIAPQSEASAAAQLLHEQFLPRFLDCGVINRGMYYVIDEPESAWLGS